MKKRNERGASERVRPPLATFTNLGQDMSTSTTSILQASRSVAASPSFFDYIFIFLFILFRLLLHHFKVISCKRAYVSADKICQIYVCICIYSLSARVCVCVLKCAIKKAFSRLSSSLHALNIQQHVYVCVCCQNILPAAAVSVNRFQK